MRPVIYARLFVITSIYLAFSFGAMAADEDVRGESFVGTISGDRVNVRAGDNTSSEVICQLDRGDRITVTGQKGKWYRIELPSKALLYVSKANISKKDGMGVATEDKVLVRTAATRSSAAVGRLSKGASVKILKEYLDWYEIQAPEGSYGWVYSDYLKKQGEYYVKRAATLSERLTQLDGAYANELKKPIREIELNWILAEYQKFAVENKGSAEEQEALRKIEEIKLKIAEIAHLKAKEEYDAKIKNISSPRPGEAPVAVGILHNVGRISGRLSKYKLTEDGKFIGYIESSKEDLGRYVNLPVKVWGVRKEVKGTALFEADAIQIIE